MASSSHASSAAGGSGPSRAAPPPPSEAIERDGEPPPAPGRGGGADPAWVGGAVSTRAEALAQKVGFVGNRDDDELCARQVPFALACVGRGWADDPPEV